MSNIHERDYYYRNIMEKSHLLTDDKLIISSNLSKRTCD